MRESGKLRPDQLILIKYLSGKTTIRAARNETIVDQLWEYFRTRPDHLLTNGQRKMKTEIMRILMGGRV